MSDHAEAIAGAMACLDAFMAAFNDRDIDAWGKTFNYPSVRLASGTMVIIEPGYHQPGMFERGALADWDHSAWERRSVIHAGPDKVHFDTKFTRYRTDRQRHRRLRFHLCGDARERPLGRQGALELRALT